MHDPIVPAPEKPRTGGLGRASNRAGGLEGGVTTGEPLRLLGAMKPISTLRKPLAKGRHFNRQAQERAERLRKLILQPFAVDNYARAVFGLENGAGA